MDKNLVEFAKKRARTEAVLFGESLVGLEEATNELLDKYRLVLKKDRMVARNLLEDLRTIFKNARGFSGIYKNTPEATASLDKSIGLINIEITPDMEEEGQL